ncbi:hypothetical protein G6F22_021203 [Rhizopus arrhizus]|nr:hypothetical protein G6F22_021203 [Rhizopus arrhizus]
MQHGSAAVRGQEFAHPRVQRVGPHRQSDHLVAAQAQRREVMVDARHGTGGVVVLQQGTGQAAFFCLGVQRDQQRGFFTRQMDLFHAGSQPVILALSIP